MKFNHGFKTGRYLNGNYIVKVSEYGNSFFAISKRALRIGEDLISEFPDSIDLKISNRCSNGCPFCHESSTPEGDILNLERTKEVLSQLPKKPIEIAIGGGNVLECLDETEDILDWISEMEFHARLTLSIKDLKSTGNPRTDERIAELISTKIGGLGISITSGNTKLSIHDTDIGKLLGFANPMTVYHVIAGITPVKVIKSILEGPRKDSVLVLGYKQWGRALGTNLPDMKPLKEYLAKVIETSSSLGTLGFDNLAIEQLGVKEMIGEKTWKGIYLGDEGSCSMYVDAVKGEFAKTSRSPERVSWNDINLLDYYASINPKRKI